MERKRFHACPARTAPWPRGRFKEFRGHRPHAEARWASWEKGLGEGDRWHPEGACVRFRFTLGSGSYATVLLREFMKGRSPTWDEQTVAEIPPCVCIHMEHHVFELAK